MRIKFYGKPTQEAYRILRSEFTVANKDPDIIWTNLEPVTERCQLVCTPCTGTDHILNGAPILNLFDKEWLEWNVYSTAEHTMALILYLAKRLRFNRGHTERDRATTYSMELNGKTLLIVGYGRVGRQVARMAKGFGLKVIAIEAGEVYELTLEKYSRADIVSIHVPLNDKTKGMISFSQLEAIKDGGIVINTSRSGVMDEDAIRANLYRLSFGLDTAEGYSPDTIDRLREDYDCILTPHVGGYSKESREKTDMWLVGKLLDWRDRHGHN